LEGGGILSKNEKSKALRVAAEEPVKEISQIKINCTRHDIELEE